MSPVPSKCCTTEFFQAVRCDNSCFKQEVAYIDVTEFTGKAPNIQYVRFGTDDDGDDLCWFVDRTQTPGSAPVGATILTNLNDASDFFDSEDDILIESATQDDKLWVVVADCRKTDYDVILKGGSEAQYFINDATKAENFRKRFGSSTSDVSGNCLIPRQQFFAFNSRTANIDGSTTHQGNSGSGDPDPIAVGRFIKITGNLVNANGLGALVYKNTVGNNAAETGTASTSITNGIFRVIDIKRQTKPGTTNLKYFRNIDAYIANPVITQLDVNCSDCLQAYLNAEGQGGTNATFDTVIPFSVANNSTFGAALINSSPLTWPCRVNVNRTFDIRCDKVEVPSTSINKMRTRSGIIQPDQTLTTTSINCEVDSDNAPVPLGSFEFCYNDPLANNIPCGTSIFNEHRKANASIETVTINTEYTRNVRMVNNNLEPTATGCGTDVKISRPAGGNTVLDFDYMLNSVSITSTGSGPITGDSLHLSVFPTEEATNALEVAILPGWVDAQEKRCEQINNCNDIAQGGAVIPNGHLAFDEFSDEPVINGKYEPVTPTIGLDHDNKVYHGRIGWMTKTGEIIPMLRYSKYYCTAAAPKDQNSNPLPSVLGINGVIADDAARLGPIDLVVPLAPQVEIAAGFNVNGFLPSQQRTAVVADGGRSDAVTDPTDGAKRCFPGKTHQSKITFGSPSVDGNSISSLPFFLQSYCVGDNSHSYRPGTHACVTGNDAEIAEYELLKNCDNSNLASKKTNCPKYNSPNECNPSSLPNCRDLHFLTSPSPLAFIISNNKKTKFNGSQTGVDFSDLSHNYGGNGRNYTGGGLSGDKYEFINTVNFLETGPSSLPSVQRVGIDSEWSSVIIEAQDPYTKGCEGCMRTVFNDSNYQIPFENDPPDDFTPLVIPPRLANLDTIPLD